MIRLKDIAQRAGLSIMTVSKALRDEHDVSASTKTRIKLLAQQMGYVPDSTAQGLRTRKTKLFGLVVSSMTNPIYARVVLAIEERAYELGYDVVLAHTLNIPEREEACLRRLLSRRVDGLFIAPVYRLAAEAPIYQELLARRIPTVLLGHTAPFCRQFVNVETDDLLASYAVTQHLLKLGHKRIAFLAGPLTTPWTQERFEGYRRALREAGLEVDDRLVFQAGRTIEDGAKAALQMISESSDATAVQAVNDVVAVGCAEALLSHGLRIPEDISVAGFGNILLGGPFPGAPDHDAPAQVPAGLGSSGRHGGTLARPAALIPSACRPNSSSGPVPALLLLHIASDSRNSEQRIDGMKKALAIVVIVLGVGGVLCVAKAWTPHRIDPKILKFNIDADNLILGLQQYREFVGTYPTGNNVTIAKALLGRSEKKVLILAVRKSDMNDKGEILDPWGTPLRFYFSDNEVMIRSAGPNKVWEDSNVQTADDLYRTAPVTK